MGDVEAPIPTATTALIGGFIGFKISAVKVVRGKQQPFISSREGFAILTVAVILSVGDFPIPDELRLEFELSINHGVIGCVNEVDDSRSDVGGEHFNRRCDQMDRFV